MDTVACVMFAIFSGVLNCAAANVVAFAHYNATKNGTTLSQCFETMLLIANIVLGLLGVAAYFVSARHGPVAVVMPIITGAKLLSSMIFQMHYGIESYNKSTRVGTLVLAAASFLLIEVGPDDADTPPDVIAMLEVPKARLWISGNSICLVVLIIAYFAVDRERHRSFNTFAIAMICAISTALGASLIKIMGEPSLGRGTMFAGAVAAFLSTGVISFLWNALAAFQCEMHIFLPMAECFQLLVNMATGILVWGDNDRLVPQKKLAYYDTMFIICLGVYLCSSYDLVAALAKSKRHTSLMNPLLEKMSAGQHARKAYDNNQKFLNLANAPPAHARVIHAINRHESALEQAWDEENPEQVASAMRQLVQSSNVDKADLCGKLAQALAMSIGGKEEDEIFAVFENWDAPPSNSAVLTSSLGPNGGGYRSPAAATKAEVAQAAPRGLYGASDPQDAEMAMLIQQLYHAVRSRTDDIQRIEGLLGQVRAKEGAPRYPTAVSMSQSPQQRY